MKTTGHISGRHATAMVACAWLLVLICGVSSSFAYRGRVFGQSFGSPGSGPGQLSLVYFTPVSGTSTVGGSGLAVDSTTHDVYVADTGNRRVDEFTAEGVFVRAWGWGVVDGAPEFQICTGLTRCRAGLSGTAPGEFETPAWVAVDDSSGGEGDVYVADFHEGSGDRMVQKFTANGALVESWAVKGQITESSLPGYITGITVTSSGTLVVATNSGILTFSQSTGTYISRIGNLTTTFPNGFGMDEAGNLYYNEGFGEDSDGILKFSPDGGELGPLFEMIVEPSVPGAPLRLPTGVAVAPSGELFVDEENAIQVVASSCVPVPEGRGPYCAPIATFASQDLREGAGLAFDSRSESLYIAEVAGDKIESIVPEPPGVPRVEAASEAVFGVSGDGATLEAAVNPRSEPGEGDTSYRFQYTTEERFEREGFAGAGVAPVPDGELSPNYEADLVTAHVQGLAPGTVYRYRVVAENSFSRKEGKLTEGERNGAGEEVARTFTTQMSGAFVLPDGRAWELVSPPDKQGALIESLQDVYVAQASTDGKAVTYFATAPTEAEPPGNVLLTQVLSTRTAGGWGSRDISLPHEIASGLGPNGAESAVDRFFSSDLSLAIVEPQGVDLPSVSPEATERTPFVRTNYTGTDREEPCTSSCYRPLVTEAPGIANVREGIEFSPGKCALNAGGGECKPRFLGASPDGSHIVLTSQVPLSEGAPSGSLYEWANGQLQLVSVLPEGEPAFASSNPKLGATTSEFDGLIRGSAISADGSRVAWSTGQETSARLYDRDVVFGQEETVEVGGKGATFQSASMDGSRVIFKEGGDLYIFEAPLGGAFSAGHTTKITREGGLMGTVLGVSQDGAYVYFVADNVLTSVPGADGEVARAGLPNAYVYHDGAIKLIAVLSDSDITDWHGHGSGQTMMTTTRVAPDGRWLAFMSDRSLTGYDNRDLTSGAADEEVFIYHAGEGEERLMCASCDPTGARPHGIFDENVLTNSPLVDHQGALLGRWLDGSIPAWSSALYQSRYLSDSGRLFFNSADGLASSDSNGTEDVYEYEPSGVGNCSTGSATFSVRSDGCIDLISSGTSGEESAFLDASENGDDVFFLTSARLSPLDGDSTLDVYDARVDGGTVVSQPPPACEGDACQSPVAAPNDPTPGSLTYRGPGNPVPLLTAKEPTKRTVKCLKPKRLQHGKCMKPRKKTKKTIKASRSRTGSGRRVK